ncbi:MAG: DHHA1 domain-containing protein [Candidatus Paceibacterota bacterium]
MDEKTLGIYHKSCVDGTMAAAVLLKNFPSITLFPFSYGDMEEELAPLLAVVDSQTTVYIVDFSFEEKAGIETLFARNPKKVITIDHHITPYEALLKSAEKYKNFEYIFDKNYSGAWLTWKYFYPEVPVPELIELVSLSDTGQWDKDKRASYVNASLTPCTNDPQSMLRMLEKPLQEIVEEGKRLDGYNTFLINLSLGKTDPNKIVIHGHHVLSFNATLPTQQMRSQLGSLLVKKYGETVAVYRITGGNVHISFRGMDRVEPSAQELAEALGGGGHRNAAGAGMTLPEFLEILDI